MNHSLNNTDTANASNKGVVCDVTNCSYHVGNSGCNAEKIQVGPHSAGCSTETCCDTFKQESK